MAQREGKFNLAIAAIRVMIAFVARPISPSDIAIWTRAAEVNDGDQQMQVLANSPDAREGFFAVPKVVE